MKIHISYTTSTDRDRELVKAGIEAGKMGYDTVTFGKTMDEVVFGLKKRCPRCGGNKFIMGVVGPGTGPQNRDIGSVPCPECNKKGKRNVK
jgi:hypothetical protein